MKRIVIVGTSGSGKTTLGKQLSKKLNIQHRDIDSFNWQKGWVSIGREKLRAALDEYTDNDTWITDGNYNNVRDVTWAKATHIIWLDYKLPLVLKRFFIRSFRRSFTQEELWNGNTETLRNSIFSRDSLFFWILKTHPKHKKEYSELEKNPGTNTTFIRLKSPKETHDFLQSLS